MFKYVGELCYFERISKYSSLNSYDCGSFSTTLTFTRRKSVAYSLSSKASTHDVVPCDVVQKEPSRMICFFSHSIHPERVVGRETLLD